MFSQLCGSTHLIEVREEMNQLAVPHSLASFVSLSSGRFRVAPEIVIEHSLQTGAHLRRFIVPMQLA
jgi:hypothetical protein